MKEVPWAEPSQPGFHRSGYPLGIGSLAGLNISEGRPLCRGDAHGSVGLIYPQ